MRRATRAEHAPRSSAPGWACRREDGPRQMDLGLREGACDWFLREITEKGKVLYRAKSSMGPQN
jgi:hypothetical protein